MKLVDTMKDEQLGLAILYNFTKTFDKPVLMEYYDLVLPLLYNDLFREEVLNHTSLKECIDVCITKDQQFKRHIIESIYDLKEMTSKALGMAMVQQVLIFKQFNNQMCGFALESSILELSEAIHLAKLLEVYTYQEIMSLFKESDKNIVILQGASVGEDINLSFFHQLGNVTIYDNTSQEEVRERIKNAHIVITNKNLMNESVLHDLAQIEMIGLFATGVNNIDIEYCKQHHIKVVNVKGYSTDTVAQHTIALAMHLIEKNNYYDDFVKSKKYENSGSFTHFENVFHDVSSMTWGIVGLGNIGRKVAAIATAMGANVQYYSTSRKNVTSDYKQVGFNTLLKTSDIISIHSPLNDATHYLFNEEALMKMKKDAYLINVGRGGIIEEKALVEVLNKGHLSGVGLDVFEHEPLQEDDILYTIKDQNKVILTPHVAWGSIEARKRCVEEAFLNALAHIKGEERNIVK